MEQYSLSVVLPVGDRAGALATSVAECLALADRRGSSIEIIIADDGGDGATAALADRLAATHASVAVIHYPRRRGYRQTLRDAWAVASGDYVVALDIAGPAAAADIARLLPAAPAHAAVFGYRVPPSRRPFDILFAAAVGVRLAPGLRDPSLGLGLFRSDLRDLLAPDGANTLVHAEIYAAAVRSRLPFAQVAVTGKGGRTTALEPSDLAAALTHQEVATPAAVDPERRTRQGAALGSGIVLAAYGLWLLRRRWRAK